MRYFLAIITLLLVAPQAGDAFLFTAGGSFAPGFFVSNAGNDSNPGTAASPFATISRAQTAMQGSSTKVTYIRAGTYTLTANASSNCGQTSAIYLTAADSAETFSYYPPDGAGTAIIDGGGVNDTAFCLFFGSSTPITIDGLQIQNFAGHGIVAFWGPTTIKNNTIHDIGYPTPPNNGGGISLQQNAQGSIVSHNYIYNIGNMGIQANAYTAGAISNLIYEYNFIDNYCRTVSDCGALYTIDRNDSHSTGLVVRYNYARNADVTGIGSEHVYMDEGASNTQIYGNVLTGFGRTCIHQNGGINNTFNNNICDLSTAGKVITEYQGNLVGPCTPPSCGDMSGMTYLSNIFISGGGGGTYAGNGPLTLPTIGHNVYHQYAGAAVSSAGTGGMAGDPTPQVIDPQLSCWAYNIASGSPVFSAPINFPAQGANWGIPGFWGPPSFVVPQNGTPPSQPHAC